MTREETIENIKSLKQFVVGREWNAALNMAIESLEKGIPIRPIMRIEEKGFNKGCIYPHCHICDTMPVPHPNVSYCDKCGQAITWENEND